MSRNRVQDAKMEGELLALTYGAIVARVMKDTEQCEEANAQVTALVQRISAIIFVNSSPTKIKYFSNE